MLENFFKNQSLIKNLSSTIKIFFIINIKKYFIFIVDEDFIVEKWFKGSFSKKLLYIALREKMN